MKLSAIVIARNEAGVIGRCLKSLRFADELIVVDADSTDDTAAIAGQAGARVIRNPWPGYGQQKNIGRDAARGEWLLFIDADEEVSAPLARDIMTAITAQGAPSFYWLRILTVFLNRPLQHLYGHNLRLFKKTAGRWSEAAVHEQVETLAGAPVRLHDTRSHLITAPVLHHSHATIRSYLKKMHRYTTLDAEQMHRTRHHRSGRPLPPSRLLPGRLAVRQLAKLLIWRRGWRDGYAGLMWCILSSYYEWEMGKKYLRLIRSKSSH